MVVTDDPDLAYKCRLYANHGRGRNWADEQDAEVIGLNYRLSEVLAAIGRVQLRHLDDWNHQRRANAAVYEELFAGRDLPVTLPPEPEWGYHTRMRYPVARPEPGRARGLSPGGRHPGKLGIPRAAPPQPALRQEVRLQARGFPDQRAGGRRDHGNADLARSQPRRPDLRRRHNRAFLSVVDRVRGATAAGPAVGSCHPAPSPDQHELRQHCIRLVSQFDLPGKKVSDTCRVG